MAEEEPRPAARRPRADAQRNRARLLDTAKVTFAEKGAGRRLGGDRARGRRGVGTLYRHFPTRDALIEAVYRNETAHLAEAAERLTATRSPTEAPAGMDAGVRRLHGDEAGHVGGPQCDDGRTGRPVRRVRRPN